MSLQFQRSGAPNLDTAILIQAPTGNYAIFQQVYASMAIGAIHLTSHYRLEETAHQLQEEK